MPAIHDVGALLFAGREYREGNDGSGVATTEDDDEDADAEAREYARDFLEVALRRLREGRFGTATKTTKTKETSKVDEHDEDVVTRSMFETLCEGVRREIPRGHRRRRSPPPEDEARPAGSSSTDGAPEAPIVGDDRGEGGRGGSVADETTTDGARATTTTELGSDVRSTARRRLPTTSAEFRRAVRSAMPAAIARAEESLMDLEGEMDESFLPVGVNDDDDDDDNNDHDDDKDDGDGDGDGDERGAAGGPMPRFGDRVDEIVDAASSTFLAFAEENGDVMTKSDGVWVEGE
jgi:hypothetical protein